MRSVWFICLCGIGVACGGAATGEKNGTSSGPGAASTKGDGGGADAAANGGSDGASGATAEGGSAVGPDEDAASSTVTLGDVTIDPSGHESGAIDGYTWVSLAPGATGTTRTTASALCIAGTIAAVTCTPNAAVYGDACDWASNWGVDLGFDTTDPRGAWGSGAPATLAVSYSGTPGTYNLLAHVAGDPDSSWYGIPNFASGQFVAPGSLALEYWNVPPSTPLTSFAQVDMLAIFLDAEPTNVEYDFCVTGISTR